MEDNKRIKKFNEYQEKLDISDVIMRLLKIKRFDIDTEYNGEFTEQIKRYEDDGNYIEWKDIQIIINDIQNAL